MNRPKVSNNSPTLHALARPAWLALHDEPILEPELPIIDPHHHLWDRQGSRYLLEELLEDTGSGHNITATVFVQCWSMHRAGGPEDFQAIGETEFVNGIAAMSDSGQYGATRACAGIVGYADLRRQENLQAVLEAHCAVGGKRFKGIRQIVAFDDAPQLHNPRSRASAGMLSDPAFQRGFALLAPLGLSFDAWLYHPQIAELTRLARLFPSTCIILNHSGGPLGIGGYAGRHDEVFAQWRAEMRDLATCPNVFVKLGGLGMALNGLGFAERDMPPTSADVATAIRPWVYTCIELFGAERCMFESNFPVDKVSYSYAVCWNAFKRLVAGCSAQEKERLFSHTAAQCYRLTEFIGQDACIDPSAAISIS